MKKLIFESYNKVVKESYEEALAHSTSKDPLKLRESSVEEYLDRNLGKWEDTPLPDMDSLTPRQYFHSVSTMEEAIELFKQGSRVCDKGLPELLIDKLMTFGDAAVEALQRLASDPGLMAGDDDFYISVMAIKVLGIRRIESSIDFLINLLYTLDDSRELIVEEITDALIAMGEPAAAPLIDKLENAADIGYIDEYALTALVKMGKEHKANKIYVCIKNVFLKMEDKILGAMCLGDYGDSRAIPALKGYAEKNRDTLDKPTYLEIKAAVKRLGGTIEDMDKFR